MSKSYCRFQNTVHALKDCSEHMFDEDLSQEERRARARFVELCRAIVEAADLNQSRLEDES